MQRKYIRRTGNSGLLVLIATFICLALQLFGTPAQAQPGGEYVLGPEDVIEVTVRNHANLNQTVTVRPDGVITFSRAGEMMAAGKTAKTLAAGIQRELAKTLNNAPVTVTVKEVHSRHVRVVGAVKAGGTYDLKPNWRVMDIIALSGGMTTKPSRVSGRIIRAGEVIPFNVEQAVSQPGGQQNISLQPDDLVVLDAEDIYRQIHVVGRVGKPGAYDLEENLDVLKLIAQTGGPLEGAALSKVHVLRGSTEIPLDLQAVLVEGRTDDNVSKFKFQAGDVLVIPENQLRFGIMGQVIKPGYYPLPQKESEATVLKALAAAGGPSPNGDLVKAGVTRVVDGKVTVIPVNLEDVMKGAVPDDIILRSDDVLLIPEKPEKPEKIRPQVHVIGRVARQGAYDLKPNLSLISLIAEAGSATEGAALSKTYILREGQQIPLNLQSTLIEGVPQAGVTDFQLQSGDVLVVPENQVRYGVLGGVVRPGYYTYPEKKGEATLLKALTEAGGPVQGEAGGDLKAAGIIRTINGAPTVISVNIEDMLKKGKMMNNVTLQPGDVLYIPSRSTKKGGFDLKSILSFIPMFGLF